MIKIKQQWLAPVPWESILTLNKAMCQAKGTTHEPKRQIADKVRQLWEDSIPRPMTLQDALNLCRKCHEMAPFSFFNANTFTAIAKTLVEDGLKGFPPVEAQIIRTTVSHYVAGQVGKSELVQILRHFEKLWLAKNAASRSPASAPAVSAPPVARPA